MSQQHHPVDILLMLAVICSLFAHPDHLCFDRTIYDNIIGPAGPLMYPDQIFHDRSYIVSGDSVGSCAPSSVAIGPDDPDYLCQMGHFLSGSLGYPGQ